MATIRQVRRVAGASALAAALGGAGVYFATAPSAEQAHAQRAGRIPTNSVTSGSPTTTAPAVSGSSTAIPVGPTTGPGISEAGTLLAAGTVGRRVL